MRIWWCAVHKMAAQEPESEEPNDCPAMFLGWMHGKPCRLVPMCLIPDNAETVERIAETICRIDNQTGPEVAVEGIPCDIHRSVAASVLAALDGVSE